MKRILIVATLGLATMASAEFTKPITMTKFESKTFYSAGGYCSIMVYKTNYDGSREFIGAWGGYADSQEACNSKGNSIVALLSMGVSPENISY